MFTHLQFENFKSWKDTGEIRLAPLTGLFGTNSSGKTAILQILLMMKQTVESVNQKQVLSLGSEQGYINLGTYKDIIYNHSVALPLSITFSWCLYQPFALPDFSEIEPYIPVKSLVFSNLIELKDNKLVVKEFMYAFDQKNTKEIGMKHYDKEQYHLFNKDNFLDLPEEKPIPIPSPIKSYGFPPEVYSYYPITSLFSNLILQLEQQFYSIYYLGPLRDYPKQNYSWNENEPQGVGKRGENAVSALLASRLVDDNLEVEQKVAYWLKELNLIDSFNLVETHSQTYQVVVKKTPQSPEVLITDVGFGVSQILPILVLCYYVPEGSTLILEQPEIHLHPFVQAGLADVFIDAIKTRNIQIILESHSEHLLRRLQRRIAEERQGFSNQDAALYFCQNTSEGDSQLISLELDPFGNISNWPDGFFGDEMGELVAMTEAAMQRQLAGE